MKLRRFILICFLCLITIILSSLIPFCLIFKETNIGVFIVASLSELLGNLQLTGFVLIIFSFIIVTISSVFVPMASTKWAILSPVMVPMFMQSNISPQFAQIVLRAGDSMTKGFTPFLASFVIYIGYLNMYNLYRDKPYSIRKSLSMIAPYFGIISLTWILIVVGWYIVGIPIGPGVLPTI